MTDHSPDDFASKADPPASLEARVRGTLASRGLIRIASPASWIRVAAALLIGTAAGYGAARARPPVDHTPRFLLTLHEDASYRDERPIGEIVAEYARWADSLAREGRLVEAERLGAEKRELVLGTAAAAVPTSRGEPTGFFLVRAPDPASAVAIAESSPHLRHGGRVVIRSVKR